MEALQNFWTFITTPGTQMPLSTTIGVLIFIALFTFIVPSFVQWRAYRRENPMEDPRQKFLDKQAAKKSSAKSTGSKSGKKKKKKR